MNKQPRRCYHWPDMFNNN